MSLSKEQRDKIIFKIFDEIGIEKFKEALAERGIRILTPELEQSLRIDAAIGAISAVNSFKAEEPKKEILPDDKIWFSMDKDPGGCRDVLICRADALDRLGSLGVKSLGYKSGNWTMGGILHQDQFKGDLSLYRWRYL